MSFSRTSKHSPACCYGSHTRQLNCHFKVPTALKRLHQHCPLGARRHEHWRSLATSADTPNTRSTGGTQKRRKTLADPEYAWLATQLHPTKNEPGLRLDKISTGSRHRLWWQCQGCQDCGRVHIWKATVKTRAGSGGTPPSGCPSCAALGGGPGYLPCFCRSVASDAQLSREWCSEGNMGVLPESVAVESQKKRVWRCLRNPSHQAYQATPHHRSSLMTGCPKCAKEASRIKTRRGLLSEEHPELAAQWDHELNDRPLESVTSGSPYMAFWICPESTCQHPHRWKSGVKHRTRKNTGSGCPFCSGHKCCSCNSLASKFPELLAEWDSVRNAAEGLHAEQVSPGSNRLVWWKNDGRGQWQQKIQQRVGTMERRGRKELLQRSAGQGP